MKRRLFSDEQEIRSWSGLTLTTHRVIHHVSHNGFDASTAILLEHVQWTRLSRTHQPLLLVLGGSIVVLGLVFLMFSSEVSMLLLAVGTVLLLIYWSTRRAAFVLAAGDGRLALSLEPSERGRTLARDFLDAVESAASRARARQRLPFPPTGVSASAALGMTPTGS